jgi:hypothetical protein
MGAAGAAAAAVAAARELHAHGGHPVRAQQQRQQAHCKGGPRR